MQHAKTCAACGKDFTTKKITQAFCSYKCARSVRVMPSRPASDRFWEKVDKNGPIPASRPELGPCWLWTASLDDKGYGQFGVVKGVRSSTHRFAYENVLGDIPDGLTLDHLCRNTKCCNPAHLEPVTRVENVMRGFGFGAINATKTHCAHGHRFDEANTVVTKDGARRCRICAAAAAKRAEARRPPRRHVRVA